MLRQRLAQALAVLAAATGIVWLVFAVQGVQRTFGVPGLQAQVAEWRNGRAAVWLLIAAVAVHPRRAALLGGIDALLLGWRGTLLPVAVALYAGGFKVAQQLSFGTGAWDLSMYQYAVHYLVAPGRSLGWAFGLERSIFSEHFSPALTLFAPLQAILPGPWVLLVGEGTLFGAGCAAIIACGRSMGLRPSLAQLVAAAYATEGALWDGLAFDFHPEPLLPLGAFTALWALRARRPVLASVALVVTLGIKEDVALVLAPLLLAAAWDDRDRWRPYAWAAALCVAWFVVAFAVALPAFREASQPWHLLAARYGEWGATPAALLRNVTLSPARALRTLLGEPVLERLRQLAFLPLLDPLSLLASAPGLLEHRLTSYDAQRDLTLYYATGPITVWLWGLLRVLRRVERSAGLLAALAVGVLPLAYRPTFVSWPAVTAEHLNDDRTLNRLVPAGAEVAAQSDLVPHLPVSPAVHQFMHARPEFVALRPVGLRWPLGEREYLDAVRSHLEEGYGALWVSPTLVVLRRGAPTERNDETLRTVAGAIGLPTP